MEHISAKIKTLEKSKKNFVLDGFMEIINPPRIQDGYKPLTYGRLSFLLKHLDSWGKAIFLGACKDSKNPSKYFWFKIKEQKKRQCRLSL